MSQLERKAKIDTTHNLPITQQCKMLSLCRSSVYYKAQGTSDEELNLMKHTMNFTYGIRSMVPDGYAMRCWMNTVSLSTESVCDV